MAFKVIIIVIELMFLGINMFLIPSRTKNIFMPVNVDPIVIIPIFFPTVL